MITKKIALFGTNGKIIKRVAEQALKRGHSVTAVVSYPDEIKLKHPKFKAIAGNLMDKDDVSKFSKGHDVVICLHEPLLTRPKGHVRANRSIIEGAKKAGIQRIVSLGHPVSLKIGSSTGFFDLCDLWEPVAEAENETLKLFKNERGLHWGYLHSVDLSPAHKTGKYSITDEVLLSNPEGKSKLAITKLTVALLNEAEKTEYVWEESETPM
ncbi:MAG TPA: NAD(P)H-binding protein [Bacteroidia bacterium]|nr:NAD(P)H-binding protein [Bacteroidia bacterium]